MEFRPKRRAALNHTFGPRPVANCQESKAIEDTKPNISQFSTLTVKESEEFLAELRQEKKWPYADDAARRLLELKTRAAVVITEIGYLGCEACAKSGPTGDLRLEGHHTGRRNLYLSEYRHNLKPAFRRMALDRLTEEVRRNTRMLCKRHHENAHHSLYP